MTVFGSSRFLTSNASLLGNSLAIPYFLYSSSVSSYCPGPSISTSPTDLPNPHKQIFPLDSTDDDDPTMPKSTSPRFVVPPLLSPIPNNYNPRSSAKDPKNITRPRDPRKFSDQPNQNTTNPQSQTHFKNWTPR